MNLKPSLAPIKVAVFPLLKNKPELVAKAREIFDILKQKWKCEFNDNGNIGKRYRQQDEIGTPYCLTIDFDTLENSEITLRDRETMEQKKFSLENLLVYLHQELD